MPNSTYKAFKEPPSVLDRLLAHPAETVLAVWNLVVTVFIVFSPWMYVPRAVDHIPHLMMPSFALVQGLGGVCILIGVYWRGRLISQGWAVERMGHLLSAGAWLALGVTLALLWHNSVLSVSLSLSLAAIGVLRYWSLVRLERITRRTIKTLSKEGL